MKPKNFQINGFQYRVEMMGGLYGFIKLPYWHNLNGTTDLIILKDKIDKKVYWAGKHGHGFWLGIKFLSNSALIVDTGLNEAYVLKELETIILKLKPRKSLKDRLYETLVCNVLGHKWAWCFEDNDHDVYSCGNCKRCHEKGAGFIPTEPYYPERESSLTIKKFGFDPQRGSIKEVA